MRPRLPSLYGYLQWSLRLIIMVAETCALGALVFLAKDGFLLTLGFITVSWDNLEDLWLC